MRGRASSPALIDVGVDPATQDARETGGANLQALKTHNIVALCDLDHDYAAHTFKDYPNAKLYTDYREMLDKEHKHLNGVTVTIPDHMHASVALGAMARGLAVHCQKPLTQSVWEARLLTKAAAKYKVPTQMGNQGYSSVATRLACEIIWNGELGDITEVHSMSGGGFRSVILRATQESPSPRIPWQGEQ